MCEKEIPLVLHFLFEEIGGLLQVSKILTKTAPGQLLIVRTLELLGLAVLVVPVFSFYHLRKRTERKFLSPVLSHTSVYRFEVRDRDEGQSFQLPGSVLRHLSRRARSSLSTSFIYFIGFVGLSPGLGKAGMAKLRPVQRTNLLLQQP